MHSYEQVKEAADYIRSKVKVEADTAIVLGSGLAALAEELEEAVCIEYNDIPYFGVSKVKGHSNRMCFGKLEGRQVVIMNGRYHYYEGYDVEEVSFPIRVLQLLGIKYLILTNAAGGIDRSFSAGDMMLITDHINTLGINPLRGSNEERFGERFPDMSFVYEKELRELAKCCAARLDIDLKEGVYVWTSGPMFETPAEIRMYALCGGSAVGMSTVPEAIVAAHGRMRVLGLSCISNMAAGISDKSLSLEEVFETTKKTEKQFVLLMREMMRNL